MAGSLGRLSKQHTVKYNPSNEKSVKGHSGATNPSFFLENSEGTF